MDKVIIIDGVDISECSYAITPKRQCPNKPMPYAKETSCIGCKEHNTKLNFCKNNPDCYYKQLKRLQHYQAEFEHELMNDYTYDGYISPNGFTPIDVIKHIKSELQRLQAENERLKENDCEQCKHLDLYIKYKQTLQEIRDMADFKCALPSTELCHCKACDYADNIIDKINEVIGAEE